MSNAEQSGCEFVEDCTHSAPECTRKVDYVYKRCYVDKSGNLIDPRTSWDELLKYHHSPSETVIVSAAQRRISRPADVHAKKKVKLNAAQRAQLAQIHRMEAQDLERKESIRKHARRRKWNKLEAQYL